MMAGNGENMDASKNIKQYEISAMPINTIKLDCRCVNSNLIELKLIANHPPIINSGARNSNE